VESGYEGPRRERRRRGYQGERVFDPQLFWTSGRQEFQIENFRFQMKATAEDKARPEALHSSGQASGTESEPK
jgi:hypothetical protein